MSSAKVSFKQQDRSAIVPALDGVNAGITVVTDKGPVGIPTLITSTTQYLATYGNPNPKLGTAAYSALTFLKQGNKLWVTRAAHEDATYACALVRSKIADIPQTKTGVVTSDHLIINPIAAGLTQAQLDSYVFPTYLTNKEYEKLSNTIFEATTLPTKKVRVSSLDNLEVEDSISFVASTVTLDSLNSPTDRVGEDTDTYQITAISTEKVTYDKGTLKTAISFTKGDQILKVNDDESVTPYTGNPTVLRTASNSTEVLISNSDYIGDGDKVQIGQTQVVFGKKVAYTEDAHYVTLDSDVSVTTDQYIAKVVQAEFEDRDAFLVYVSSQGSHGKDVSVAITENSNYDNAFNIVVYFKGVQVETHEVTRSNELDGFQKQLNMEFKINGKSAYIKVKNNVSDVDSEGTYPLPLFTTYSLWRQDPSDVFVSTTNTLKENLIKGHVEVKLTSLTNLEMGTRIKFLIDDNATLSKEYKILSTDAVNKTITLDRAIEEDQISMQWTNDSGTLVNTVVYYFNASNNDAAAGIVDGIQYYEPKKVDKLYPYSALNSSLVISSLSGKLLSGGSNLLTGGSLGSTVTVADLVTAVKKMSNKEATPINLMMDGGFATPAFAQAIKEVCDSQGIQHGYLSTDPAAEDAVDYLSAIVSYKNSLNLNTETCSLFAGWIKILDEYNQQEVWTSPESFAAASQSYTTRNSTMFTPAAGWTNGKIDGLDVKVKFSEGDRDYLVENRINPIRQKDGSGLVIWGNETLLTKPSPLQLRSVAMLLIVIKTGFESVLEYKTFDLNTERNWSIVEGSLNAFMRDEIKAKDGVYDYTVAVQDVITDTDIDNRRMPVFLGIQPTMDIKEIPVTLAIFNSSVDISVSL